MLRASDWVDVGLEGRGLVLQRAMMDARSLRIALTRGTAGGCWALAARCDALANDEPRFAEALAAVERRHRQGHDGLAPLLTCVANERTRLAEAATAAFRARAPQLPPTWFPVLLRALAEELRAEAPLEQAHRQAHLERGLFRAVVLVFGLVVPAATWWDGSMHGAVPTMFDLSAISDSSSATAAFTMAGLVVIAWQVRRLSWDWLLVERPSATRASLIVGAAVTAILACWAASDALALAAAAIALVLSAAQRRDLPAVP